MRLTVPLFLLAATPPANLVSGFRSDINAPLASDCDVADVPNGTCASSSEDYQVASEDGVGYNDEIYDLKGEYLKVFSHDLYEECDAWAHEENESGLGRCEWDKPFMLTQCPESCQGTVHSMLDSLEEAAKGFSYYEATDDIGTCENLHEMCDEWAEEGQCLNNATLMLDECQKSCRVCFSLGVHLIHFGNEQIMREKDDGDDVFWSVLQVITKTAQYMVEEVMVNEEYKGVRRDCFNYFPMCSLWASQGECDGEDRPWMQQNCSPACQTCKSVEFWHRCRIDPDEFPEHEPAYKPGDLGVMFERIVNDESYAKYDPVVLSRPSQPDNESGEAAEEANGPWIVRLDNFLTEEEADKIIALTANMEFELSQEVSHNFAEDGSYDDSIKSEGRTSTNSWCDGDCYDDPVATNIRERIFEITGLGDRNAELFQLLKYEVGQFYWEHHDYIVPEKNLPSGPRVLTVFMYLNDVEEGGETAFTTLNITVPPKKGAALIWPSVLDEEPNEMDNRTWHEAKAVKKGVKYAVNAWLHLRDFWSASDNGCN